MMDRDAKMMRGDGPTLFCQVKHNVGIPEMIELITEAYRTAAAKAAGQRVEEPSTKRTKQRFERREEGRRMRKKKKM